MTASLTWKELREKIGIAAVNKELDERIKRIFGTLRDIASLTSGKSLTEKVLALKESWIDAVDQYERSVLHLAALNGNTRLVCALIDAGAHINLKDGIGQTPLTLALHMGHSNTAKYLIEYGASVCDKFYDDTIPPLEITIVKENHALEAQVREKIRYEKEIVQKVASLFRETAMDIDQSENVEPEVRNQPEAANRQCVNSRSLNINVGDQKNTVTIQSCANKCPDLYACHTPGGGDFHNRAYLNESIARIAGQGGFWHVLENVMKRPTVNPTSFGKGKFKENNYNNNEEALLDYDDGLSVALIKTFQQSTFFPTPAELDDCFESTQSHNEILMKKLDEWMSHCSKSEQFVYHSQVINELVPITRWYKESIRNGNGIAIEGVWMLLPALYVAVGKTNYKDEAFTQIVNSIAKWPLAFRKLYQQNRTVNLDGKQGRQLAGDEWVEDFLVRPIKQFASAQSSFNMVELMSCSANLLEMNRTMYKSREAFDLHSTKKHKKPSSTYDQLKVAQFALREGWFDEKESTTVLKYPWGDVKCKPGEQVSARYLNAYEKGNNKAKLEFSGFLHRKYPNDMF